MSIFDQDLIVQCYIFIVRVIARNFYAKFFFRLFLIFFAQTCSDLFIFEPKPIYCSRLYDTYKQFIICTFDPDQYT